MEGSVSFGAVIGASLAVLVCFAALLGLLSRIRRVEGRMDDYVKRHWESRSDLSELSCNVNQGFRELGLEWTPRSQAKWTKTDK